MLAESALRLLAGAWTADIADTFARDEQMLTDWACRLPHRDFKLVLNDPTGQIHPLRPPIVGITLPLF